MTFDSTSACIGLLIGAIITNVFWLVAIYLQGEKKDNGTHSGI